ncbi:haloacid dehalogenase [Microthyrium microscopicum]|uniref:Haloacid dehalogenase n=1 Tax=Microthyrium microscopicum TaxID=703497 RepID=A0A6A6TUF6_9PEZI|nr:haloacid dehalogenase [Microthyrium microscopicum]
MSQSKSVDKVVLAFDVYGTLLSTASIAEKLSAIYGKESGPKIAAQWRRYQLEYTWRLNSMKTYLPFTEVTSRALHHAVRESGGQVSTSQTSDLMEEYDKLDSFPDVKKALDVVVELTKKQTRLVPVLFSNGTKAMVEASVKIAPGFNDKHRSMFEKTILIDEMPAGEKVYKPSPKTYEHLSNEVGAPMEQIWLISSNPFDIVGAHALGMKTAWVDRVGSGWVDALSVGDSPIEPHVSDNNLENIIDTILMKENIHAD